MHKIVGHIRRQIVAYVALVIALAGTSYAAVSIPNGSITAPKLNAHSIGGYVRAWAHVRLDGRVLSGSPGAAAAHSPNDGDTPAGLNYFVGWRGIRISSRCAPIVTVDDNGPVSSRGAWAEADIFPKYAFVGSRKTDGQVELTIASPSNSDVPDNFFVAVVC